MEMVATNLQSLTVIVTDISGFTKNETVSPIFALFTIMILYSQIFYLF